MAYPKRAKGEDANAESRTTAPGVTAPTVPPVGVPGSEGGAPKLSTREPRTKLEPPTMVRAMPIGEPKPMSRFFRGGPVEDNYRPITPGMMPLEQVQTQFRDLTKALQDQLAKHYDTLPEGDRARPFWQGFQQYKEWMPALMVRRMLANRLTAQGEVAEWMTWLGRQGK